MKKIPLLIIVLVLLKLNLTAQVIADSSIVQIHSELKDHITLGIQFLEKTQRKETDPGKYYRGEWPSFMTLRTSYFFLGSKNSTEDSNCFAVASTHNALAKIYLLYPEYDNILPMLDLSFEKIMSYRNGDKFNFWNLLPPNRKLKKGDIIGQQHLVRRPTNYKLKSKYINNAANVTEDADDTGLAYTAIALRKQYKKQLKDSICLETHSVAPIFEAYKDIKRNNRHWYNYITGNDHNTGAYLTWLGDEYEFKNWNILKVIGHNATFYLPFSECYPHPYQPYIPYGTNDLDGVVNANVLSTLSYYNELDASGVESAVRFIEKKSKRKKYDRVGIYYPNRYHFPYAVSKAYVNGVDRLKESTIHIQDYLLEKQNKEGSWSARQILNKKDKLQSTAYALNALINIGDFEDQRVKDAINKGIGYVMKNAIMDSDGIHWEGGVFFSGGTVVRNILWWKSDAYTTTIILSAFANYRRYLELTYDL